MARIDGDERPPIQSEEREPPPESSNLTLTAVEADSFTIRRDRATPAERRRAEDLAAQLDTALSAELGRASRSYLYERAWPLLVWAVRHHKPMQGDLLAFAEGLVRKKIVAHWPRGGVARERDDERRREAALNDEDDLVRYLDEWRQRLSALQRAYPNQWSIPDCDDEEARERMLLALLEAMLDDGDAVEECARPWCEATFRFLRRERTRHRNRRKRLRVVDGFEPAYRYELPQVPTPEELLAEREAQEQVRLKLEQIEPALTKSSRRYLELVRTVVANDTNDDDRVADVEHGRWTVLAEQAQRDRTTVRDGVRTLARRLRRVGLHHHLGDDPDATS